MLFAIRVVVGYVAGVIADILVGLLTGTVLYLGLPLSIFNEALSIWLGRSATFLERVALDILIDEIEHFTEEAAHYFEDSEAERDQEARALARDHPHNVYLFGQFSVADAGFLAASAYKVGNSEIPEAVLEISRGLLGAL